MRRSVIAASLLLTSSLPVLAQNLDTLRDGLDHLPAVILMQDHGDLGYFIDAGLMTELGKADFRAMSRLMFGPIKQITEQTVDNDSAWWSKTGTTPDKLRYFAGFGRSPAVVTLWGLTDAAAADDMMATLGTFGFENAGAPGVIGNGEPMKMDPQKRDATDPWRTMIGAAQFAAVKGSAVVQAQNPQSAMLVAAEQPSLGENPTMKTALAGIEQSAGDRAVLQAMVISPLFGMSGLDPAAFLSPTGDLEETQEKIEQQMEDLQAGIPPYLGGIVADFEGDGQGIGIALTYPDCEIAQAAADTLSARWVEMAGAEAQGEIVAETAEGIDGLCATAFTVSLENDNPVQNPAYRAVTESYMRNEVGVLQIGQS